MGDSNGDIRLFHLKDGQPYLCLRGHGKDLVVTSVAFSQDGQLLASSSIDRTLQSHCWLPTRVFKHLPV